MSLNTDEVLAYLIYPNTDITVIMLPMKLNYICKLNIYIFSPQIVLCSSWWVNGQTLLDILDSDSMWTN